MFRRRSVLFRRVPPSHECIPGRRGAAAANQNDPSPRGGQPEPSGWLPYPPGGAPIQAAGYMPPAPGGAGCHETAGTAAAPRGGAAAAAAQADIRPYPSPRHRGTRNRPIIKASCPQRLSIFSPQKGHFPRDLFPTAPSGAYGMPSSLPPVH